MKAIVFDVDGVIIISAEEKNKVIAEVLKQYNLYDVPWVQDILAMSFNRKIFLEKIYELQAFDKAAVIKEINTELEKLESNPLPIDGVLEFIKKNHKKYLFFTNTSLPRDSLKRILLWLDISHCFKELYTWDDGFKKDNINTIIDKYWIAPDDMLFIDDTISHIESVAETGINLLHFYDANIDIDHVIETK